MLLSTILPDIYLVSTWYYLVLLDTTWYLYIRIVCLLICPSKVESTKMLMLQQDASRSLPTPLPTFKKKNNPKILKLIFGYVNWDFDYVDKNNSKVFFIFDKSACIFPEVPKFDFALVYRKFKVHIRPLDRSHPICGSVFLSVIASTNIVCHLSIKFLIF